METVSKCKEKLWSETKGLPTSIGIKNKLYASGDMIKYNTYRSKLCTLTHMRKKKIILNPLMIT